MPVDIVIAIDDPCLDDVGALFERHLAFAREVTPPGHVHALQVEAHHTRRISESGPDHPRWVIALCPTCHRRVHHSVDGAAYSDTDGEPWR